jgi:hypothetical protein
MREAVARLANSAAFSRVIGGALTRGNYADLREIATVHFQGAKNRVSRLLDTVSRFENGHVGKRDSSGLRLTVSKVETLTNARR